MVEQWKIEKLAKHFENRGSGLTRRGKIEDKRLSGNVTEDESGEESASPVQELSSWLVYDREKGN
jgi:hypothetical protein